MQILVLLSKGPQILMNFSNKHTGELAFITTFLQFGGNAARTFTLIVSSGDILSIVLMGIKVGLERGVPDFERDFSMADAHLLEK